MPPENPEGEFEEAYIGGGDISNGGPPDPGKKKKKPPRPGKDKKGASVGGFPSDLDWYYDFINEIYDIDEWEDPVDIDTKDKPGDLDDLESDEDTKDKIDIKTERPEERSIYEYVGYRITFKSDGTRERSQEWCPYGDTNSPKCFLIHEDGTIEMTKDYIK